MYKYVLKRLAQMVLVLVGVTFIVYGLIDMTPGDPAIMILGNAASPENVAKLHEEMHLDDPLMVRYVRYMWNTLHGDLGTSYKTKTSVSIMIAEKLPNTAKLAVAGMIIAVVIGIPAGIICAIKQYSVFDNAAMISALVWISAPSFWLGLMLIIIFSLHLGWFPASGMGEGFWGSIRAVILPAFTACAACGAVIARITRSAMLEIMHADYITTARSKGLKEWTVIMRHMFRNVLIPVITITGLEFGIMLGGACYTESVFAWPGLGRYLLDGVKSKDTPVILGCVIVISIMTSLVNLVTDIIYAFVDPRIKAQYKSGGK